MQENHRVASFYLTTKLDMFREVFYCHIKKQLRRTETPRTYTFAFRLIKHTLGICGDKMQLSKLTVVWHFFVASHSPCIMYMHWPRCTHMHKRTHTRIRSCVRDPHKDRDTACPKFYINFIDCFIFMDVLNND